MSTDVRRSALFGIDPGRILGGYLQGLEESLAWPALAWLKPRQPVRVRLPDGGEQWFSGDTAYPLHSAAGNAAGVAVMLPEERYLARDLNLPDMLAVDLEQAVSLQIRELSPFPEEDLVWGWRILRRDGNGALVIRAVLASRRQIHAFLAEIFEGLDMGRGNADEVEVWAGESEPVVLRGFAEPLRERRARCQLLIALAMLVLCVILAFGLAATPFLIERAKVFDAQARHVELAAKAASAIHHREALLKAQARLQSVQSERLKRTDIPRLIEVLTAALPDDAYLIRLEVNERGVRIGGLAGNAAALVEALGSRPGFEGVRTPSAISRAADGRESFVIEFTIGSKGGAG